MNDIQTALSQLRNAPPPSRAVTTPAQFKDLPPFLQISQTVNSFVANQKFTGNFFGIKLPLSLNYPGTQFSISLDGGEPVTVQTGDELIGPFGTCEVLSVSVDPQFPTAGGSGLGQEPVGFVLYRRPDFFWIEVAQANAYPYSGAFRATPQFVPQAYNTTNPPSAQSDGVDSSKAKAIKFFVHAFTGDPITGGTLRIWRYLGLPGFGVWCLTATQEAIPTGDFIAMTSDFPILTPGDFFYGEAYNVTTTAGVGDIYVFAQFGY